MLAASSLQTALDPLAVVWRAGGGAVRLAYGASGALVRQLEQGAPADIFISADEIWMDEAEKRRLVRPATRRVLAGNRLVLVSGPRGPRTLRLGPDVPRALGAGRLATADPASTPLGRYARAGLAHFGLWEALSPRLAPADTARSALALVASGEAPLGVVYATDAQSDARVRVLAVFPPASHPPVVYPAALTPRAGGEAARLLAFLASGEARGVWDRFGFTRPPGG